MENRRKLLLIIGFPRSGTKLLRAILCNHEQIFLTHELVFLPHLLTNWDRYGDLSVFENFERMHRDIMNTDYFFAKVSRGDKAISAQEWYKLCATFDPVGVFSAVIRRETGAPDSPAVWLGDKSPNYTTHLLAIKRGIPEAKVVHIVRDGRDAALSARKVWRKNIYRFVQRWADGMRRLQDDLRRFPANDVLEVRYEDLLTGPDDAVRRLLDFLGLDYQLDVLKLHKPPENRGDTRYESQIVGDNFGKYKAQLSERQIRRMESVSWDMLKHYRYEVAEYAKVERVPGWLMIWYSACDLVNRLLFDIKLQGGLAPAIKSIITRYRTRM